MNFYTKSLSTGLYRGIMSSKLLQLAARSIPTLSSGSQIRATLQYQPHHPQHIQKNHLFTWITDLYKGQFSNGREIVYPDQEIGKYSTTKVFLQAVRHGDSELHNYLLLSGKVPVLLNFTYKGDPYCNKLTKTLYDLLNYEIKRNINLVDVEADEVENKDLLTTYRVTQIPMIVAVQNQLIVNYYKVKDIKQPIDKEHLKNWIDELTDK